LPPLSTGEPSGNILHHGEDIDKEGSWDSRLADTFEGLLSELNILVIPALDLDTVGGFSDR
jgi:hypothetical protein